MLGPVLAAAAVSTLALLSSQATRNRAQSATKAARGAARRAEREARAATREASEQTREVKRKAKKAARAIVDATTLPTHKVDLAEPSKPAKKKPAKKKGKPKRALVKADTVLAAMILLGVKVKKDGRFNSGDKRAFAKLAKGLGLPTTKIASKGKGKTAIIVPASTWTKIKARAVKAKAERSPALRPREAAEKLYSYVTARIRSGQARTLGDKANPNVQVREYQRAMGKIATDGIYGPATRKRGKELTGKEWPARSGPKVTAREPAPITVRREPAASPAPEAELPTVQTPEPPPIVVEPKTRAPQVAASELADYARRVLAEGKGYLLGVKNRPSETVRAAQVDMGKLATDGIYGPSVRARIKELTGKAAPIRR